ncbi:MAG: endonuclease/exonuclease/phosphatase family protein [Gammaproteobacteria bacterium]|nr:endonuclease/exonuclease/phosphatase family protein [Gammaproteobacteria bacterium]
MIKLIIPTLMSLLILGCSMTNETSTITANTLKIATFNVSMDATNYVGRSAQKASNQVLINQLKNNSQQIRNIAQIIQTTRPDVILLNEFDYIDDPKQGVELFIKKYLNVAQGNAQAIDYPYYYYGKVNTGKASPFDLTGDGKATGVQGDAWGFGFFEGHFGMMLLSRYPIDVKNIRTFQNFKWSDMPNALRPIVPSTGKFFYSDEIWQQYPLSSKSHWDVPVLVNGATVHVLASHPTPPVFDGPEDRNGTKNHDEVRFWLDYVSGDRARYIYDDKGTKGGLTTNSSFVIMGDQNSSSVEGSSRKEAIGALLSHINVNDDKIPQRSGGLSHQLNNNHAKHHTAHWGMRADYVLPSRHGLKVINNGVFWPQKSDSNYHLIKDRNASSDHRLVWSELEITE